MLWLNATVALAGPPPKSTPAPGNSPSENAAKSGTAAPATAPASRPAADATLAPEQQRYLEWRGPTDPLGAAGTSDFPRPTIVSRPLEALPLPDRWRLGWPSWDRYNRQTPADPILMNSSGGDSPYTRGDPLNPYDRNILKGDYPLITTAGGEEIFFSATGVSDTLFNYHRLPTPSGASAAQSTSFDFFGDGRQSFVSQTFLLSLELFKGYTSYRPTDWLVRVTPAFNLNYLHLEEFNGVNIDVRDRNDRNDSFGTLQEAFFELHLGDASPMFDIAALRAGRQFFISDFRGFIYSDVSDGLRLLGNLASNRIQYNLALFNQNDKDTNSELTELNWRDQQVAIANLYVQDFLWPGYTAQWSVHWNHDQSNREYDNNGFPVIPDFVGSAAPHDIDAVYLGWAGDGHVGRVNVDHAFYYVTGHDDKNPIAGRGVEIGAFMAALEVSVDIDWLRPKLSLLYASGDRDPLDRRAGGFDGIVDNPLFAGGPSSFYQSQALRLLGVNLTSAKSLFNDLAATKGEGQSNYVNPGTILVGAGLDAEITPKLRGSLTANSIWMADTAAVELLLNQPGIDQHLGEEVNLVWQYRPLLNNNIILTLGGSLFFPAEGFRDIYQSDAMLYQLFTGVTLSY